MANQQHRLINIEYKNQIPIASAFIKAPYDCAALIKVSHNQGKEMCMKLIHIETGKVISIGDTVEDAMLGHTHKVVSMQEPTGSDVYGSVTVQPDPEEGKPAHKPVTGRPYDFGLGWRKH